MPQKIKTNFATGVAVGFLVWLFVNGPVLSSRRRVLFSVLDARKSGCTDLSPFADKQTALFFYGSSPFALCGAFVSFAMR